MVCVCVCVCVFLNMRVHVSFQVSIFSPLDKYPKMEWLNHMAVLVSIFLEISILCFIVAVPNLHSYQQCIRVPYLCIIGSTCYCLSENRHYDMCEIIYLTILLICIFLISYNEHLFRCLLAICMSSLEKHLFISFVHF